MSNPFESNSSKNSLDQVVVPFQQDNPLSSFDDNSVASYRTGRLIVTPQQLATSQTQLDQLGYGSFVLTTDSQPNNGTDQSKIQNFQFSDSAIAPSSKSTIVSTETPQERIDSAVSQNDTGSWVLGPYKLSGDSVLTWISNLNQDELSAMQTMAGGVGAEAQVIAKLNVLAQAYKQGKTPEQAKADYSSILADPEVLNFMHALSSMRPGSPQPDGAMLAAILNPSLQRLIAGDIMSAASQVDSASHPESVDTALAQGSLSSVGDKLVQADNVSGTVNVAPAVTQSDASILPGPLQTSKQ